MSSPVGPFLESNPVSADFGDVTIGSGVGIQVTISNVGDLDCHVTSITSSDPQYTQSLSFPLIIPAGGSVTANVVFAPTGAGSSSASITAFSDAINGPNTLPCSGNGVAPGSKLLSVSPSTWDFGQQKDGTPSPQQLFTLTNTGTVALTITALAYNGDFSAGATQPALPYVLNPSATVQVGVIFTPSVTGLRQSSNALVITSDATGSPQSIVMQGTGFLINPAFVLTGATLQPVLGFANAGTIAVKTLNPSTLATEAGQSPTFSKLVQYDPAANGFEDTLLRIFFHYEDLGPAVVQISVNSVRLENGALVVQNLSQQVSIGFGSNGQVLVAFADFEMTAELFTISVQQISGPVSIIDLVHRVIQRGEVVPQ